MRFLSTLCVVLAISWVLPTLMRAEALILEVGPQRTLKTPHEAANELLKLKASHPGKPIEIRFDAGTYELKETLRLGPEHSGKNDAPVLWKAVEPSAVEFTGFREHAVASLPHRIEENGTWSITLPEKPPFSQIWINGQRGERAKHPNVGTISPLSVREEDTPSPDIAKQILQFATPSLPFTPEFASNPENWKDLQLVVYHKWDNTRRRVTSLDISNATLTTQGQKMKSWNVWDAKSGIVFENAKVFLDAPGEWFLEEQTLHYHPRKGETPENTRLRLPLRDRLLDIKGSSGNPVAHLAFEGIRFSGTGWNADQGFNPQQAAATIGAVIEVEHAHHVTFRKLEVSGTSHYGIWFRRGTQHGVVEECVLEDLGAGGLRLGETSPPTPGEESSHHRLHNNLIQHTGKLFPCAVGIWIGQSSDNTITHHLIRHLSYSGISVGWVWGYGPSHTKRNRIEFNHIHHIGDGELSDMGAIYTLGSSEGTVIRHNHIHDVQSKTYGGWGLYTDEGSTGIVLEKNLVYRTKTGGFHQHYGKENVIQNNIFAFSKDQQLQFTRPEEHLSFELKRNIIVWEEGRLLDGAGWKQGKIKMDHNLFWSLEEKAPTFIDLSFEDWKTKTGHDQHSLFADPKLEGEPSGKWLPQNVEALKKIGFESFDPSLAGLTGSDEWKRRASEDPQSAAH